MISPKSSGVLFNVVQVVVLVLLMVMQQTVVYGSLSDVTSEVFDKQPLGIISAFGDLDANKATDFFVLSPDGEND